MVNSPGAGWLTSWMPPKCTELGGKKIWNRRRAFRCWLRLSGSWTGRLSLGSGSSWRMPGWSCCSCPHFPKDSILHRKGLWAQPRIGLAGQRVAGLFFFGWSRGDHVWGRSLPFFQNCLSARLRWVTVWDQQQRNTWSTQHSLRSIIQAKPRYLFWEMATQFKKEKKIFKWRMESERKIIWLCTSNY